MDSRGAILRCIGEIKDKDPASKITLSFIDLAIDNIRDLLRHAKKNKTK